MAITIEQKLEQALESIAKLEEKNKELQTEKQRARADADAAQEERDAAAEKAERDAKDVEALEKRLTAKFQKDLDNLTRERDTVAGELRTIRVDNEITKAMSENNVRSEMSEALAALVASKVKYENNTASVDGQTIGEYLGKYLGSETGAFFRRPADNSGSNASGSTSVIKTQALTKKPVTAAEWAVLDAMPTAERNAFCDSINEPTLKV